MDEIRKLHNEFKNSNARFNTRRHFLKECTLGLGGIALGSFLNSCSSKNVSFNYNADLFMCYANFFNVVLLLQNCCAIMLPIDILAQGNEDEA